MQLSGDSLQDAVSSFLRVQDALRAAPFSAETVSALLALFNSVWRQAVQETQVDNADDRQVICIEAANAVIALAKAGVQPRDIQRYALAHVLFLTTSRDSELVM